MIVCRAAWLMGSMAAEKKDETARRRGVGLEIHGFWGLRAAFGSPGAGAIARAGGPHTRAVRRGQPALTIGALVAARDLHGHGAILADLAADRKRGIARITDCAVV